MRIDEAVVAEDLAHASNAAKAAIEPAIRDLEAHGVTVGSVRPCEAETRDGTRLGGCVKHYIPQPDGQWGAVFSIDHDASKPALLLLAVGERSPGQAVAAERLRDRASPAQQLTARPTHKACNATTCRRRAELMCGDRPAW